MQTMSEVLVSSQDVLHQAIPKQAPPIARIRDARGITMGAKCALYSLHSREPNIFPSMKTLAADMCTSLPTAKRAVRELKRLGYLRVTPRIAQTNLYSITVAGDPPPLSPWTPPPVTHDPPPYHPGPPPPVSLTPPPRSPMTPPPGQCDPRSSKGSLQRKKQEREQAHSLPRYSVSNRNPDLPQVRAVLARSLRLGVPPLQHGACDHPAKHRDTPAPR